MEIRLLGGVELGDGGGSATLRPTKPARVLAMLALAAPQVVTTRDLMVELWQDSPPRSSSTTLQTYICTLRGAIERLLDSDPRRVLRTRPGGYLLDGVRVDAQAFRSRSAAAREAATAGDHASAAESYRAALALWRGPVLAGLHLGRPLTSAVTSLDLEHQLAVERWARCEFALGNHDDVISRLSAAFVSVPTDERTGELLMLALAGSARRERALDVYAQLRRAMIDALGIEPGERVKQVQRQVLQGRPVGSGAFAVV